MNGEKKLPTTARIFLVAVGGLADITKIALDFFFGIGIFLDPMLISPVAWVIFWITFNHNGIPMFSGKRGWMGWVNLGVGETPGVDASPNWTIYALCV